MHVKVFAKEGEAENLYNRVGNIKHLKFLLLFDAIKQHHTMLKNKKAGIVLSRDTMKNLKGGIIPPPGGCLAFGSRCRRTDTCCDYWDGSPVFCTATGSGSGTCTAVA